MINRPLLAALYLVALGLIVVPLIEATLSVWPLHPDVMSWRFGATGILSRGLLTTLLGLGMACGASSLAGHRRLLRLLAVACGVAAPVLMAGSALVLLDAIQLGGRVQADARVGFYLAALGALLKLVLGALVTGLLAWGGWIATPRRREPKETPRLILSPQMLSRS